VLLRHADIQREPPANIRIATERHQFDHHGLLIVRGVHLPMKAVKHGIVHGPIETDMRLEEFCSFNHEST
jgi:hypothetical protein